MMRSAYKWILVTLLFFAHSAYATIYDFAVIGDAGAWNKNLKMTRDSMRSFGIHRLILPGDNVYEKKHKDYHEVWQYFTDFTFDVVALGNHNYGFAREMEYFEMPSEYYIRRYGKDILFIVLNSENEDTVSEQIQWADTQLQAAKEKFIFLVYHHPTYTVAKHKWTERKPFQLGMRQLIKKHKRKIDALLLGHDHISSAIAFGDTLAVVSGTAQDLRSAKKLDYIDNEDKVRVKTLWLYDGSVTWSRLRIDTNTMLANLQFITSSDNKVRYDFTFSYSGPELTK